MVFLTRRAMAALDELRQLRGDASPSVFGMTAKTIKLPGQGGGFGRAVLRPLQLSYEDVRLGRGLQYYSGMPAEVELSAALLSWIQPWQARRKAEPPWNYMLVHYQLSWTSTATLISGSSTLLIQG